MKIDESCIGLEESKNQTEYSDKLYAAFYQSHGNEPCSSNILKTCSFEVLPQLSKLSLCVSERYHYSLKSSKMNSSLAR